VEGVYEYQELFANCDHMPGADRAIRVGGTVVFRTGGWSADLRESKDQPGINQFILHLDLVLDPPEGAVTEVLTPVELPQFQIDDPEIEYEEVHFKVVGSEDKPPDPVTVVHTQ
jgi:hypothetical protein